MMSDKKKTEETEILILKLNIMSGIVAPAVSYFVFIRKSVTERLLEHDTTGTSVSSPEFFRSQEV